jgi:DNA polymerase-3 subunit epsilon
VTAPWWEGPLVGFDLETTSPDPETARIVTACVVVDTPGESPTVLEWLVDPGMDIPEGATAVHGITTEHARAHGVTPRRAITDILLLLVGDIRIPLVAFNACYDFTVLDREARRHGLLPLVPYPVIDPYVVDKQVDKYRRGSRKLTDVAAHYGVTLDDAHNATADALAAVHVARAIATRTPGAPADAQALHDAQILWRAQQSATLQDYFRRTKDQNATVDGSWPLIPWKDPT